MTNTRNNISQLPIQQERITSQISSQLEPPPNKNILMFCINNFTKLIILLFLAYNTFIAIYNTVLSFISYNSILDLKENNNFFLLNNLKIPIIEDILISENSCPLNYSSIIDWQWQGTYEGCDCTYSFSEFTQKGVQNRVCTSQQIEEGCITIESIPAYEFTKITDSNTVICLKRSSKTLLDVLPIDQTTCGESMKTCGNPQNFQSVTCVNISEPCPVYSIRFSNTTNNPSFPPPEWKELRSNDERVILYMNQQGKTRGNLPISEFRFSQVGVCANNNQAKSLPSGESDSLLAKTTRIPCSEFDETYKDTLIRIPEQELYRVNIPPAEYASMSTGIPEYSGLTSSQPFILFEQSYINWKLDKRYLINELITSVNLTQYQEKVQLVQVVVNLVTTAVVIILSIMLFRLTFVKEFLMSEIQGQVQSKNIKRYQQLISAFMIQFNSTLVQMLSLILSKNLKDLLETIASFSPNYQQSNSDILSFASIIESTLYKNNLEAVILSAIGIIFIIKHYFSVRHRCQQNKLQQKQANRDNNQFNQQQSDKSKSISEDREEASKLNQVS